MLGQLLLGKYRVLRQLDEGGMSKIYLARQDNPGRDVIVKVLKEPLRVQTKAVEHFRREIYIMSRFHHPNSVEVYDSATRGPHGPLMVMEYLRGVDMAGLLAREGRLTAERTGRLLVQLCEVLQAAHDQGIVHRDLKPGNLMILHGGTALETVKLMDFGLAKMNSMLYISPDELVDFNLPPASGTPEYISPEMVRGIDLDGRGDLYSVGVMLFEMLTGRRPFLHNSVEGLMLAHANEAPPSFAEVGCRELVSPAVEAVVQSCLAKHPDHRPSSARELALAYERALGRRLIVPRGPAKAPSPRTPAPSTAPQSAPGAVDRNAFRHSVEANMPEAMAMIKLKGFVYDLGGEVVESVPGMIKVRLVDRVAEKKKAGLLGWTMGTSRQAAVAGAGHITDIELHMERPDPAQASKLTITLVMRPGTGIATTEWRNRCSQICRDLKSYLMGR
ncbi:MAG: serine/threonine-protein kinase [Gemmataceae bacterium]